MFKKMVKALSEHKKRWGYFYMVVDRDILLSDKKMQEIIDIVKRSELDQHDYIRDMDPTTVERLTTPFNGILID